MVSGFSRWCVMRGYLKRDLTLGIKGPRALDTVPRALEPADVAMALRHAPDARAALMICLGVQLGLRCCEIATVQVGDVDRRTNSSSGKARAVASGSARSLKRPGPTSRRT